MKTYDFNNIINQTEVLQQLHEQIKDLDFDYESNRFLELLSRYRQVYKEINYPSEGLHALLKKTVELPEEKKILDPEQLIARFLEIYEKLDTRFDIRYWQSVIESDRKNSAIKTEEYCMPIAGFLMEHSYLKSDVFFLLKKAYPFDHLFQSPAWKVLMRNNEKKYVFIERIMNGGNFEQDLLIDTLPIHTYASEQLASFLDAGKDKDDFLQPISDASRQLDDLMGAILHSSILQRDGKDQVALQVLNNIPFEKRPLIAWQRMMQILYKAAILQGVEEPKEIFPKAMAEALRFFSDDEHLLYLQAAFRLETRPVNEAKEDLVMLLKKHPQQDKLLFLLGKCYFKLEKYKTAYTIFKHISELYPLNLEYASFIARSLDGILSQPIVAGKQEVYVERMLLQLEMEIYDLIAVPDELNSDPDIRALKNYAESTSEAITDKDSNFIDKVNKVQSILDEARTPKVRNFLINRLLKLYPTYDDLANDKDRLLHFYEEFPEIYDTSHALAGAYMGEEDYEKALSFYEKAKDLNGNIYVYQGIARAALHLEQYDKSIAASRVFQQARRYDRTGFYCMGKSYFNMEEYLHAYENFKWMVQIVRPQPSAHDQYVFMASLSKFMGQKEQEGMQTTSFKGEIEKALELFDSFKRPNGFEESKDGQWAVFHAAKLCEYALLYEKGLLYVNELMAIWYAAGFYNLRGADLLKGRLLMVTLRFDEAQSFLQSNIEYLEQSDAGQEQIDENIELLGRVKEQLAKDSELSGKLRFLIQKSAEDPDHWRHVYVQLVQKAMMTKEHQVMITAGLQYFSLYDFPHADDIFMAYWTANAYKETNQWDKAKPYFERCVALGEQFPGQSPNLVAMAGLKLRHNS
ncbi:tetratricopeptide repeat protein [Galbibacter sp. EGI 63066]|uniref:tetratricopeptide repeat protein n=1 Tax=Galbibacter sp. EGI 63066 TaxID=2993559 RepID=UPI00224909D4|nr:tetratricopeptide repeat protein [Galbibacter sp. EGI 63066]MCX2681965.1 tetratricopeptide repeat protein [Galbibacter sp. EGI 63066]